MQQPVQIVFALDVRVETWLAAGGRVEVARPSSCPACGHEKVTFDGWYPRHTRRGRVAIQRVLCADEGCGQRSQSELWERVAVGDLRDGHTRQALAGYAEHGRLTVLAPDELATAVVDQRQQLTGERGSQSW